MKIKFLILASAVLALSSCKKEDSGPSSSEGSGKVLESGVMVLNEGQFLANNASITLYDENEEISNRIFASINDKATLGDVLQSAAESESAYYLVLNNSGKIEVTNKNTFKSIATIEGFSSPRYFLDMKNGKALVSNFVWADSNEVDVNLDIVNTNTNTIEGNIKVKNWCEMMCLKGETVYVANTGKNQILMVDRNTLAVTGQIQTPHMPTQILEDKNGKLWVLCIGDSYNSIPAAIVKINPSTNAIEKQIDFLTGVLPTKIAMNGGKGNLFVLSDKLFKTSVNDPTASLSVIPNIGGFTFAYGLGVDPITSDIYVGDAKDFISKGIVKVFNINGDFLKSFESGVNPNGFVFR